MSAPEQMDISLAEGQTLESRAGSSSTGSLGLRKLFQTTEEICEKLKKTGSSGGKTSKLDATKEMGRIMAKVQKLKDKRRKTKKKMMVLTKQLKDNEEKLERLQKKQSKLQQQLDQNSDSDSE